MVFFVSGEVVEGGDEFFMIGGFYVRVKLVGRG